MSGNVHEAILVAKLPLVEARAIHLLRFQPVASDGAPAPFTFRGGQFISLRVGVDEDQNPILRSYSIASSSGEPHTDLVVRWVEGGAGTQYLQSLADGARVRFTGPMGFFVLELSHPGDVVFGVTGVGIAPVLPMLRELASRPERAQMRVILLWGNASPLDFFWQAELDALAEVRRLVSRPDPSWTGERGRITQPLCDLLPSLKDPTFYLVGNGDMTREARAELVARGVDRKRRIRSEAFHT